MNPHLEHLLSHVYDDALAPEHLADLRKSGLTDETISGHKIRAVPPAMIRPLLGFEPRKVRSAYIVPFPDPAGGFMDHVKLKIFSNEETIDVRGDHVEEHGEPWRYNRGQRKYLVRRRAQPRLYFPLKSMSRALLGDEPLWVVEGMKKSLAVAQLECPAIGIESAWSWHPKGSSALLPDFGCIMLRGRIVEVVPDSDVQTNLTIARSMRQLGDALRAVGARPRLVRVPAVGAEKVGIDDYLMMSTGAT